LTYPNSDGHKATASTANAGEVGAPGKEPEATAKMRKALFPGLKVPVGLTFEDLARAAEMVLAWERNDDEFADDFRSLMLVAKLYEYLRAADSARNDTGLRTD
jgi:hypothetical protein